MNRKEASFILANIDRRVCDDELNEALDMAIKALEQMPVTTTAGEGGVIYYPQVEGVTPTVVDAGKQEPCDNAVSRQDVLDLAKKGILVSNGNYESVCKAINELPSVIPQPCEDAIDRAEAIKIASGYCHPANVAKELAKLPAVNPQPCEDAISRQAVRHILNHEVKMPIKVWKKVFELVDDLPPVIPQPKTGHCKDCKWWKDSDGTYCRGVHAESKCPINRKEVYEGNGYCYMFEPQERSDKE